MKVRPTNFKNLIAINEIGKLQLLSNMVMRKPLSILDQQKNLKRGSVCITCNYHFAENELKWSDKIKVIGHPFRDGNKRTAAISSIIFLDLNGYEFFYTETDSSTRVSPTGRVNCCWQNISR